MIDDAHAGFQKNLAAVFSQHGDFKVGQRLFLQNSLHHLIAQRLVFRGDEVFDVFVNGLGTRPAHDALRGFIQGSDSTFEIDGEEDVGPQVPHHRGDGVNPPELILGELDLQPVEGGDPVAESRRQIRLERRRDRLYLRLLRLKLQSTPHRRRQVVAIRYPALQPDRQRLHHR